MEVVISIAATITEHLVFPIGRQFGYLFRYKRNIQDFRNQVQNLKELHEGVQGLVDAAKRNGEIILPTVQSWLTKVEEVIKVSMELTDSQLPVNKHCFNIIPVPDLKSRHQRSRAAKKKTVDAEKLKQDAQFDRVSNLAPFIRSSSTKDVEDFETRKLTSKEIVEAMKDDQISTIGIYGIGGVGKTTLAKEVAKQARNENIFDDLVMAVVSPTPDLKRIQQELAELLGMTFVEETIPVRAGRLCQRLKEIERVLVILDDVWERVELEDIGIPFGAQHKGCKIMLTSRSLNVCNQMDSQKNFYIEVLSQPEAWNLFQKMAGDSAYSPDLHPLAIEIVNECAGLPIAIVTIARALRNKSFHAWRDAANQLSRSIPDKKVYSTLELSFNNLQSEEAKSFLLLCCLLPEGWSIDILDLVKYGMGLGLFQDINTVDEARTRAYALVESLKYSCLLQDGISGDTVKMHDVVRDVAISIASKGTHVFLVTTGKEILKEWPKKETFEPYTAISVTSNNIKELPDGLECPKLQILLLECSNPSLQFPDNFVGGMQDLKVLDMSRMHFLSLPSSLQYLGSLRTLCLDGCNLKDISIIGELKKLEILSFIHSDIKELAKEIGKLTQLKLLDLRGCEKLVVIPPDVIRSLSQLEEFYLTSCFDKWEIQKPEEERSNISLADLNHLSRLTTLEIHIPDANCLPEDLLFENLSRFKISVGTRFGQWDDYPYSKLLKLKFHKSFLRKDGVKALLKKAEYLHLEEMKGLESVFYDLDRDGFPKLKCLNVKACHELEYIFNATEFVWADAFPVLEKLDLSDLPNLKEICHGQLPTGLFSQLQEVRLWGLPRLLEIWKDSAQEHVCFTKLRVVEVGNCDVLKNIFPRSIAKDFPRLQELTVISCNVMKEIFGDEKGDNDNFMFPCLHSLKLEKLPSLLHFYSNTKHLGLTYTEEPLFDKKDSFPKLEKLHISGLTDLRHLFSPSIAGSLVQLQILEVHSCEMLKAIVADQREGGDGTETIVFPQLHTIELKSLPNLTTFCQGDFAIQVQPFFSEKVEFLALNRLVINEARNLKEMWDLQLPTNSFPKLKVLEVQSYSGLLIAIPFSLLPRLESLEELSVEDCDSVEEIVEVAGFFVEEKYVTGMLSQLRRLKLRRLPKLKHIWLEKYPHGRLGFQNLSFIHIYKCNSLKSLFSPSVVRSLVQLFFLKVESCERIETVIAKERDREENCTEINILFPHLQTLMLNELPNLLTVYTGRCRVQWPSLKTLNIWSCPSMNSFTSISPHSQKHETNDEISEKVHEKGNYCISKQPFFDNKVALTNVELLSICDVRFMEEIFHYQISVQFLSKLTFLVVAECPKLSRIIPSSLLPGLKNLKRLKVERCNLVEEIFGGPIVEGHTNVLLSQLEKLELEELPNLRIICSTNYTLECPCLSLMQLKGCYKTQTFSSGIIRTTILKTIKVDDDEEQWNGDLNSTIQHLFLEKEANLGPAYDAYSEGDKLREKKLYEEALSHFENALQFAPKMPSSRKIRSKCHLKRGWCFFNMGKHEDELKEYTKALEENPTCRDALFDRGVAHENLKHFEEAIADMKKFLDFEPSDEGTKLAILRLEPLAAEKREMKEAGLGPAYDAYLEGDKLREKFLYEEALSKFEIALQVAPNMLSSGKLCSKCHSRRGWCFFNMGKHVDEIKEYTKALELNPTYKDALFDRGVAHEKLGHFKEAIADMRKLLEFDSSEKRAKFAILRLQPLAAEM